MEFFNLELGNEVAGIRIVPRKPKTGREKMEAAAKASIKVQNQKDPILKR